MKSILCLLKGIPEFARARIESLQLINPFPHSNAFTFLRNDIGIIGRCQEFRKFDQQTPTAMTLAGKSVYYFGFYLLGLGLILTAVPNLLLSTFQLPETNEVWIRVVGVIVFNIGLYYVFMAPQNNTTFLMLSVFTRAAILLWFIVFAVIGWAPYTLVLFGLVDAAGAVWTYTSLKKS
jgi:hypothetical protein